MRIFSALAHTSTASSSMVMGGARLACQRVLARSLRLSGGARPTRSICSASAKQDGGIDPPDLKELAAMAHIGITDAEVTNLQ